jgi:lipopolysaccharide/colanic/teichoic acid biosynthesis glycosyltransferase
MNNFLKRLFDIIVSLICIIFFAPVFVILSIWINLDSSGPILFKQQRVGLNGKPFTIYKFRSMYVNDEADAPSPESTNDPRLTRVGKFIRKTSLDELPQLFNVLKGDMSIVGPRAITEHAIQQRIKKYAEVKKIDIKESKKIYEVRKKVKPGMTGLTQVNGRSNAGIIAATELDYYYAQNFSFWLDMKIILKTIGVVLFKKGTN